MSWLYWPHYLARTVPRFVKFLMAMKRGYDNLELSPIKVKYPVLIAYIKNGGNESQSLIEFYSLVKLRRKGQGQCEYDRNPTSRVFKCVT